MNDILTFAPILVGQGVGALVRHLACVSPELYLVTREEGVLQERGGSLDPESWEGSFWGVYYQSDDPTDSPVAAFWDRQDALDWLAWQEVRDDIGYCTLDMVILRTGLRGSYDNGPEGPQEVGHES